ncbi:ABC transporter ATP-binding protein [Acuticoccus sediminis]|uniref:ABC transporter ATP-binding protein n=1 Tax=Acuticoccus sediminis TaxID=2184697 RepID=UPI001CFE4B03|nr:ABC transporter ATP-binding protein [Acuticoccus sediminis]
MTAAPLLEVSDLRVSFPTAGRWADAVRGVSFSVAPGEAVGLVGESGSGKSVSAFSIMGLLARPGRVSGGSIRFEGQELTALSERSMAAIRGREISMVFQDPLSSLNPAFTVGQQLVDTIRAHRPGIGRREARERAADALSMVGIADPGARLGAYPHEFSGGMRQRVMIALAISSKPKLLIADEPTTALDVTVQAQVVELLETLREEMGLAILFISHNLDLVAELCDRVLVMYAGSVVEEGPVEALFRSPEHPYTRLLQRCIPRIDRAEPLWSIEGAPPPLGTPIPGCAFADRCPEVMDKCRTARPLPHGTASHAVSCWVTT